MIFLKGRGGILYTFDRVNNRLVEIKETSFYENQLKEREHIEEWIRKDPEILGEELLIIAHEYDRFEVNERLDLLALDKEGNVVVIEVKRDTTGSGVDFQALKYVSYCARLTPIDILELYAEYLTVHDATLDAKVELMDFLQLEDEEELNSVLNTKQRIIIVGKEIDKRILSVCTWLYENSIDIKCVTIKPYILGDQLIMDVDQIIPPYQLEDYYINKKEQGNNRKIKVDPQISSFLQEVSNFVATKTDYTARYSGNREYFKGHRFLEKKWNFVFSYKKDRTASMFLESYRKPETDVIKAIAENSMDELEKLLGHPVQLMQGSKNTDVYRLVVTFEFDEDASFEECLEKYTSTFEKYYTFILTFVEEN